MECYANVANTYEITRTVSNSPVISKQENNKATNKKTVVIAISFGISFVVSVAAFILIMQIQNEMKLIGEKLDKMGEIDSSLASNINNSQKEQVEVIEKLTMEFNSSIAKISNETQKKQVEAIEKLTTEFNSSFAKISSETQKIFAGIEHDLEDMKNKLESKIFSVDNKLNASLTDANTKMNKMFSISGWFRASNNLIYKRFTGSVTYALAKAHCGGVGARLVSTGMRNNNNVKNGIFPNDYLSGRIRVWIGMDDINSEGMWVWSDGLSGSPMWETSEPNGGKSENCAVVILINSKIGVHDVGCSSVFQFVCEREFL